MLKALCFAAVASAVGALVAFEAQALPLAAAKTMTIESDVTLVRDGCGRGYRFSNRRQACVPEFDDRGSYRRAVPQDDPGAEAAVGIINAIVGGGGGGGGHVRRHGSNAGRQGQHRGSQHAGQRGKPVVGRAPPHKTKTKRP